MHSLAPHSRVAFKFGIMLAVGAAWRTEVLQLLLAADPGHVTDKEGAL